MGLGQARRLMDSRSLSDSHKGGDAQSSKSPSNWCAGRRIRTVEEEVCKGNYIHMKGPSVYFFKFSNYFIF